MFGDQLVILTGSAIAESGTGFRRFGLLPEFEKCFVGLLGKVEIGLFRSDLDVSEPGCEALGCASKRLFSVDSEHSRDLYRGKQQVTNLVL